MILCCRDYLGHFIRNPHSLIVKIFGVFRVVVGRPVGRCSRSPAPVFLVVMQSVFYPPPPATARRFDLKGCTAGRYQTPGSDIVCKDQNFAFERLRLGGDADWFRAQLRRDTEFLRCHGIVDFSLLVGLEPRLGPEPGPRPPGPAPETGRSERLDREERRALWSSLARILESPSGEDAILLDGLRLESRLSNMSALVELLGDGSRLGVIYSEFKHTYSYLSLALN